MRRRRKKLISTKMLLSIFISFILVTSILGFIFGGSTTTAEQLEYGGYRFTRELDYWTFKVGSQTVKLNHFPTELSAINVSDEAISRIKATKMVYVSAPINAENIDYIGVATYELSNFLIDSSIFAVQGISDNNTGYALPLIDCQNATPFVPVITFENTNQTQVIMKGDCIVLEAKYSQDFLKLKDKIVLKILGIE